MEVSGQMQTSIALPPEKEPSIIYRRKCWMGAKAGLTVLVEREMMIGVVLTKF